MKNISLSRIYSILPDFNRRQHTEDDIWRICKKFRLIVKDDMPLFVDGYHERKKGRYYIIINKDLRGSVRWLHTAFHELCHFLFDVPDHNKNYVMFRGSQQEDENLTEDERRRNEARERWADAFADVCPIPWPAYEAISKEAAAFGDGALLTICEARRDTHSVFNL